jgi:hypothetical protein
MSSLVLSYTLNSLESFAKDLMQYKNSATDAEADALAFLNLNGMDED